MRKIHAALLTAVALLGATSLRGCNRVFRCYEQ